MLRPRDMKAQDSVGVIGNPEVWFQFENLRKTGRGQRGHRGQMPLLRDTKDWISSGPSPRKFTWPESRRARLGTRVPLPGPHASHCRPSLQGSWKPWLGPVRLQGGPAAGRGAAFWAHKPLLADLLAIPFPAPRQWLQEGPGWESASGVAQRLLIHASQELPVK